MRNSRLRPVPVVTPLPVFQLILLCAIMLLSPLVAGKLAPIPAFSMQTLVLLATIVWISRAHKQRSITLPGKWVLFSLIGFFGFLLLSAWQSASLYLTVRELLNFASYVLVFLMVISLGSDRRSVYLVLGALCLSSLIVGIVGVKEYILTGGGGWRTFSTFYNPDFLAGFTAMMLPVALGWYLSRASFAITAVAGLTVLYMVGATLITGSRFGALAAAMGVIAFLVLTVVSGNIKKSQVIKIVLILIPLLAVHMALSKPLTARVATTKAESHSGGFRIQTWKGTARMAFDNPINGTGLGTFGVAYPKYASVGFTKLAHNSYIQIAGEAGIPSALLLIVFLGATSLPPMIAVLRRRVAADHSDASQSGQLRWMPETGLMLSGLIGGAYASMARNVVDSDWYVSAIGLGFWAILGAVVSLGGTQTRRLHLSRNLATAVVAVAVLVIIGVAAMLSGELTATTAEMAWMQRDAETAMRLTEQGLKLDPLNAEYHRRLGRTYQALAHLFPAGDPLAPAASEIRAAINLEPGNAKNYYQLARILESARKSDEATGAYEKAMKLNPNAVEVMLSLARAYERAGRQSDALHVWRRMVEVERSPYEQIKAVPEIVAPEYIFAHAALGREAERAGNKSTALMEYKLAVDRIVRYQASMKGMREILEANGRRNPRMEEDVDTLAREIKRRIRALLVPT